MNNDKIEMLSQKVENINEKLEALTAILYALTMMESHISDTSEDTKTDNKAEVTSELKD